MTARDLSPLVFLLATNLLGGACTSVPNYTDPSGPRYIGDYRTPPQRSADPIRLVTFNIKFGAAIERAVTELSNDLPNADVIVLQEMDAAGVDDIARGLQLAYVYYPASLDREGNDVGNAVLSRWPMLEDQKILLPHENPTTGQRRVAVATTVVTDRGAVRVYCVHIETPWMGLRGRLDQVQTVIDAAVEIADPIVVAGDFNTGDPGSLPQTVDRFQRAGFAWATRGVGTTSTKGPIAAAADHVFSRGLVLVGAGKKDTEASDHRPVWTTLAVPPGG